MKRFYNCEIYHYFVGFISKLISFLTSLIGRQQGIVVNDEICYPNGNDVKGGQNFIKIGKGGQKFLTNV